MAKKKAKSDPDDLLIPYEEAFPQHTRSPMPPTKFAQALAQPFDPERPLFSAIRGAVAESGLNTAQLAERTGLTRQTIFRYFVGERDATTTTLDVMCKALDFEVSIQPRRKATG